MFKAKAPPLIGLDISHASVRMVELTQSPTGMRLERYAVVALDPAALTDGAVAEPEVLTAAIEQCFKRLGSKIKGVAAALPPSMIVMKTVPVPAGLNEQQIEMQVRDVMVSLVGFSIDDASLDFIVGAPYSVSEEEMVPVTVAVTLRQRVEERSGAIDAAGLKPIVMDSELLALIDATEKFMQRTDVNYLDRCILLVDVGPISTHYHFLRNGEVIYSRDHAFGGLQLERDILERIKNVVTQEIAEKQSGSGFGPDIESSIASRSRLDDPANADIADIVKEVEQGFAESLAHEARRAVQMFTTSTQFLSVDTVLLSGCYLGQSGLAESVSAILSIPTRLLNPFDGMALASGVNEKELRKDALSLVVACGLAMRRFDQ